MSKTSPLPADQVALAFLTPHFMKRRKAPAADPAPSWRVPSPFGDLAVWDKGAGPTVLLVHGWEGSHRDLDPLVPSLLAAGYRVVQFDLPAHGQSAGSVASIPDLAHGIRLVADRAGPLAAIVAHSIGCAATTLALDDGLVAGRVVLVSPPQRYAAYAGEVARQLGAEPEAVVAAIRARGIDIDRLNLPAMATRMSAPALFIHSADDRVVPIDSSRASSAAWPGARLIEVDGLGHNRILGDEGVIRAVTGFVTG